MANSLWIEPWNEADVETQGDFVNRITDKSGAGNHLVYASSFNYTVLNFDLNSPNTYYVSDDFLTREATFAGNAFLDTAQFKYGDASCRFDGSGDYVEFGNFSPYQTNEDLAGNDFTIELWLRFAVDPGTGNVSFIGKWDDAGANRSWQLAITNQTLRLNYSTDGNANITFYDSTASWNPAADVWYHLACCRSNNEIRFYVDGAIIGSPVATSPTDVFHTAIGALVLGAVNEGAYQQFFNGWFDSVRIINGVALYEGSSPAFTPPTERFAQVTRDLQVFLDKSPGQNMLNTQRDGMMTLEHGSPESNEMDGPDFTAVVAIRDYPYSSPIDWTDGVIFGRTDDDVSPLSDSGWRIKTTANSPNDFRVEGSVGDPATSVVLRQPTSPQDTFEQLGDGILTLRYNSAQSTVSGFSNGIEKGGVIFDGTPNFNRTLRVGDGFDLGTTYGVLYFDNALGTADIQRAEGWFAHEWGIQDVLPSYHPFRKEGPDKEIAPSFLATFETDQDAVAGSPEYVAETGQVVTLVNGASLEGTHSKFGYNALRCQQSSSQYATIPSSADYRMTQSQSLTVEFWIWVDTHPYTAFNSSVLNHEGVSGSVWPNWNFYIVSNASPVVFRCANYRVGAENISISSIQPVVLQRWYHVAITWDSVPASGVMEMFIDGVSQGTASTSQTIATSANPLYIGHQNAGTTDYFDGFIDSLCIEKDIVRYTRDFTPPKRRYRVSPTAAFIGNFNGIDAAASPPAYTSEDTGARPATFTGNAQLDTAQAKFGSGSVLLDGAGDRLEFADSADYELGAEDFTVETWVRWSADPGTTAEAMIGKYGINGSPVNQREWQFDIDNNQLRFGWTTDGTGGTFSSETTAFNPVANQWYHLAATRSGGNLSMYIDGVLQSRVANSVTFFSGDAPLYIGGNDGGVQGFTGNIDSARVIKGEDIYGAIRPMERPFEAYDVHANDVLVADFEGSASIGITSPPGYTALTGQQFQWDGNATIAQNIRRTGEQSLSTPAGTDGIVLIQTSPESLTIGTQEFAIEYWFRTSSPTTDQVHWDQRTTTTQIAPALYVTSVGQVYAYYVNGADRITGTSQFVANQWYHVCLERINGVTRLYINGQQEGSAYTDSNNYLGNNIFIGKRFTSTQGLTGYMDGIRFRIGSPIYGGDFTPPEAPFGEPIIERGGRF